MKKFIKTILILLLSSQITFASENIATVDLQKIVNSSEQVKTLKKEHDKRMEELNKIIINARQEIANEQDSGKVLMLEEKYTKEFNDKKNSLEKEYISKLNIIDKNIREKIAKKAKDSDYKYVFAKSVLLYGGDDLTESLIKEINK